MAKSPDRWLRAAAAEGLSLRQAAVLVSPGKSARPHYHPAAARQPAAEAPPPRAATPFTGRFDSFAAGEAGAEPYSARLHTVDRQRMAVAPAEEEDEEAAELEPPAVARGGGLDFAKLAADREAYLQVGL